MIKNAKKTAAEKTLIKFRDQLHKLLIKHPEIRISGNIEGDPVAWIRTGEGYMEYAHIHLPTNGQQELISK